MQSAKLKTKKAKARKAIVLLSGGLDSTTALAWVIRKGYESFCLLISYGQRHQKEIKSARAVSRYYHCPTKMVRFDLPWGGSSLTEKALAVPHHALHWIGRGRIPSTYVPARNTIFLSLALSWADAVKAGAIVIGANAYDYSGYPDCRPAFYNAFAKVGELGTRRGTEDKKPVKILTPLIRMTKADIVRLGTQLEAPFHLTWSCYQGGREPCGKCDSCQLRAKGFREAGMKDPIL